MVICSYLVQFISLFPRFLFLCLLCRLQRVILEFLDLCLRLQRGRRGFKTPAIPSHSSIEEHKNHTRKTQTMSILYVFMLSELLDPTGVVSKVFFSFHYFLLVDYEIVMDVGDQPTFITTNFGPLLKGLFLLRLYGNYRLVARGGAQGAQPPNN